VADYLVRKGLAFRDAHEIVGKAVAYCVASSKDLPDLTLEEWRSFSDRFDPDISDAITLEASVNARAATGGTARPRVLEAIERAKEGR
jgi:argininosuccinate lyase